jgi:asparagine synthase (glutamine-hydrolysing)
MPGICGYVTTEMHEINRAALQQMQDSLACRPYHIRDPLFLDKSIGAARVHTGIVQKAPQPFSREEIYIWFDGEFYTDGPHHSQQTSDPQLLLEQYVKGDLVAFMRAVDGIFVAVIYDRRRQTIHFVSDRYGLRRLYIGAGHNKLCWASELKAFRHVPGCSPTIDKTAVQTFMSIGHLTGKTTWFSGIELLEPATILRWDLRKAQAEKKSYWNWKEIPQMESIGDRDSLAERLGAAFRKAVARRCLRGERIGIGLSGGLDSRAIFAAIPEFIEPIQAFTFGENGCLDLKIAQKCAALRPTHHHIHILSADNWLNHRIEGVWRSDGQYNLLHMHGFEYADENREFLDIKLNGFLGDALVGGSYGNHPNGEVARFLDRGRRFIALGYSLGDIACHTRIPFFDNELMELVLSIPWQFRRNSSIYNAMLLKEFPAYFVGIPWQKTGLPISRDGRPADLKRFLRKIAGQSAALIPFLPRLYDFVDYPGWIRRPPASRLFRRLLKRKDALIYEFVDPSLITRRLALHMAGFNYSDILGRYLTLEIWLQQFYHNNLTDFAGQGTGN